MMKSPRKSYKPRGYQSSPFSESIPNYEQIIEYANNPKNELDIQFRGDYINIYYLGGSLLKLKTNGSIVFDKNYFYRPTKEDLRISDIEKLLKLKDLENRPKSRFISELKPDEFSYYKELAVSKNQQLIKQRDLIINQLKEARGSEVGKVIEQIKSVMLDWKKNLRDIGIKKDVVNERQVQHYISLFNKESESCSDYVVIDLEYELSENSDYCISQNEKRSPEKKQPKIDIVAIEKNTGQLYVMELKYGMKSTGGEAGIAEHYEDYLKSVGNDNKWHAFLEDITFLVEKQKENGVLTESIEIKDSKPVFAFVYKPETDSDECIQFMEKMHKEKLDGIPVFYLPVEKDYKHPTPKGHYIINSINEDNPT